MQFSGLDDIRCRASDELSLVGIWRHGVSTQYITHENTNDKQRDLTTAWLPFEMVFKISAAFQGCDCVILVQAGCLSRHRKEFRTGGQKTVFVFRLVFFLDKGNSYGNPTKGVQCPVLKKK